MKDNGKCAKDRPETEPVSASSNASIAEKRVVVAGYFDGHSLHAEGPYAFRLADGRIAAIEPARADEPVAVAFLLPSLVDAHVHVFLEGGELDPARRRAAMAAGTEALRQTALANARRSRAAGIGLERDAGAPEGINHWLRDNPDCPLHLRSAGIALHRPKRYGGFLGPAVGPDEELTKLVGRIAEQADDIKVLLTGVVDFETGEVKGEPQFSLAEARAIVATARACGRPAFAHCNGPKGLAIAARAGFDSVEHGYRIDEESLRALAGEGVAWTPTLAPVAIERKIDPAINGFAPTVDAVLERVLAAHARAINRAVELGVPIYCGSDAGGQGVPHGTGLIDEMLLLHAAGVPMELVLRGATSLPRERWGESGGEIAVGVALPLLALPTSPYAEPEALRRARWLGLD